MLNSHWYKIEIKESGKLVFFMDYTDFFQFSEACFGLRKLDTGRTSGKVQVSFYHCSASQSAHKIKTFFSTTGEALALMRQSKG